MTGIVKTDQIQGAGSSTVTIPSGTALNVTTVSGTPTFSGDVTLPSINGGQIGGRKNVFINGAMQVFQRSTNTTGIGNSAGYFTADRIRFKPNSTAGRLTSTQDSSAPNGFANSLKLDCTTADTSIGAGEYLFISQKLEGQDLQRFAKGTSDAKPFTVSFYVKGNASATYTCELFDEDNTRQISKTFSVTTSWTRVELLFPADTTGAFDDDTASSMTFAIWLHAGTNYTSGTLNSSSWASATTANRVSSSNTSFFDSTDRTFFLTGLQLETSSIVTPFEHRSFGEEVALCKRYFEVDGTGSNNPNGWNFKSMPVKLAQVGNYIQGTKFAVEKRADPTVVIYSRNGTSGKVSVFTTGSDASNNWSTNAQGVTGFHSVVRDGGTHTVGTGFEYGFTADAEL